MQSLEESIYSHIPMVGMPFFGDQNSNVKKLVAKGFGLFVDPRALDEGTLKSAILEVAENPKYVPIELIQILMFENFLTIILTTENCDCY